MATKANHMFGMICVFAGVAIIIMALGSLLARLLVGLVGLSLINYGLKMRGLPPLQVLIPMIAARHRFFR
jgi:hypothetical protein